jgi:hypothetical protein
MFRRSRTKRSAGQALVEFALAATLIFMLLSAAVDLGMIFFTLQGLRAAAQEGATFGSHPVVIMDPANPSNVKAVDLPYAEIVDRVRFAGGISPAGFANLLDLNNDGQPDDTQSGVISAPTSATSYIYIENLKYSLDDLNTTPTTCKTDVKRTDMRLAGQYCYVRVTVRYNYKFIFPLAPVFGNMIQLQSSFIIRVRSSFVG